jgi:protein-S-isoprenylcysteine O-methyltransferase Ste14
MIELNHIKKHRDRPDLSGEHIWGDIGQIILFILFFGVWIVDSFVLKFSIFLSDYISWFIRVPISLFILICSSYLARSGLKIVFGGQPGKSVVIREGVFRCVRHPIYLGAILLYLGLIFLTVSILSAIFWLIIILFYYFISRFEEKILFQEFGNQYKEYMEEVPMLIPSLFKKKDKVG